MNDLLKDCTFDFSKAGSILKMSILAVVASAGIGMSSPAAAHGDHAHNSYSASELKEFSTSAPIINQTKEELLQGLVDTYKPNAGGKEILDDMERRGLVKTPITLDDYKDIVTSTSNTNPNILIRNPFSLDSLSSVSIVTNLEKKSTFLSDAFTFGDVEHKPWKEVRGGYENIQGDHNQKDFLDSNNKVQRLITDNINNFEILRKFNDRPHPAPNDSLPNSLALNDVFQANRTTKVNYSKNSGVDWYLKSGDAKIGVGVIHIAGGEMDAALEEVKAIVANPDYQRRVVDENLPFMTSALDENPLYKGELSNDEKTELNNVTTLIHEMGHSLANGSLNKFTNSTIYNVHDRLSGVSPNDSVQVEEGYENGEREERVESRSLLFNETFPDLLALTVVAANGTEAEWEHVMEAQINTRKISYINNYNREGGDIKFSKLGLGEESMQIHDTNYLSLGWMQALELARNGINPELLDLANDPLKLAIAVIDTSSHVMVSLEGITNDWSELEVDKYNDFISIAESATVEHVQSDEFKSVMSSIEFDNGPVPSQEPTMEVAKLSAPSSPRM